MSNHTGRTGLAVVKNITHRGTVKRRAETWNRFLYKMIFTFHDISLIIPCDWSLEAHGAVLCPYLYSC